MSRAAVTLRSLKPRNFKFADGQEIVKRYAVVLYGERVGTVHHVTTSSGHEWFDPLAHKGDNCRSGDGQTVTRNFVIQRKKSLLACVKTVVKATSGRSSDLNSIDLSI